MLRRGLCRAGNLGRHTRATSSTSSVNQAELDKFRVLAEEWWDPSGVGGAGPLHAMSAARVDYIRNAVLHERAFALGSLRRSSPVDSELDDETLKSKPLLGMKALDVGCGGGLLSEPLARLGAKVTGVDPSIENVGIARAHAELDPGISDSIDYQAITAEALYEDIAAQMAATDCDPRYDVVCALEVVEHITDKEMFLANLTRLVKPGGLLFLSSINRTMKAYALTIFAAEVVTKIVPRGTHEWEKFPTPAEMSTVLRNYGMQNCNVSGMVFVPDPFVRGGLRWTIHKTDTDCNYIMYATKPE